MAALAHNELPNPPDSTIVNAAYEASKRAHRYPEWDNTTLRVALAEYHGVKPDWVVTSAGSVCSIQQIMLASGPGEVVFSWPSFDGFPVVAAGVRMPVQRARLANGAPDLDDILARITPDTALVIICTPNAPTGGILSHTEAVNFLRQVPKHVTVHIDEAYAEFAQSNSKADGLQCVRDFPNVVLTRTFSKAYGLAGFRVGYAIAQPPLAKKIFQAGVPFAVPIPAEAAALQALRNPKIQQQAIKAILAERERMAAGLRKLGADVHVGHGNFVWLPVGEAADRIAEALAKHDVHVKPCTGFGIRITVGTADETDQLITAWQRVIA